MRITYLVKVKEETPTLTRCQYVVDPWIVYVTRVSLLVTAQPSNHKGLHDNVRPCGGRNLPTQ